MRSAEREQLMIRAGVGWKRSHLDDGVQLRRHTIEVHVGNTTVGVMAMVMVMVMVMVMLGVIVVV